MYAGGGGVTQVSHLVRGWSTKVLPLFGGGGGGSHKFLGIVCGFDRPPPPPPLHK